MGDLVSIPHRKVRDPDRNKLESLLLRVSIPHRKVRDGNLMDNLTIGIIVSIPHRKVRDPSRGCPRQRFLL